MGYLMKYEEGGAKIVFESDTVGCNHCQRVLLRSLYKKRGGFCFGCGKTVCEGCAIRAQTEGCMPFMKRVEKEMAASRFYESIGGAK